MSARCLNLHPNPNLNLKPQLATDNLNLNPRLDLARKAGNWATTFALQASWRRLLHHGLASSQNQASAATAAAAWQAGFFRQWLVIVTRRRDGHAGKVSP